MTRARRAVLLGLLVALVAAAPAAAHSRAGGYQQMARDYPRDWDTTYPKRGGLPIVPYPSGLQTNPSTIAAFGLANWSLWVRHREPRRLRTAIRAADWLRTHQRRDGTWGYGFDYVPPGSTETLPAGWASALSQGQAISLLGRAFRRTRDRGYRRAFRRAVRPLGRDVARGGLARRVDGALVLEEYPTTTPNGVLNGQAQALIGLHDVADLDRRADRLLDEGARGLSLLMARFDSGAGWSRYSLADPSPPPASYPELIEIQLRILSRVTGRARFARYADLWRQPVQHAPRHDPGVVLGEDERPARLPEPGPTVAVDHELAEPVGDG